MKSPYFRGKYVFFSSLHNQVFSYSNTIEIRVWQSTSPRIAKGWVTKRKRKEVSSYHPQSGRAELTGFKICQLFLIFEWAELGATSNGKRYFQRDAGWGLLGEQTDLRQTGIDHQGYIAPAWSRRQNSLILLKKEICWHLQQYMCFRYWAWQGTPGSTNSDLQGRRKGNCRVFTIQRENLG